MGQQQTQKSITVFFSYARADQAVRDRLATHLSQMKRDGLIEEWSVKNLIQDSFLSDLLVEDETDQTFDALPLITPPATLVDTIMAAVAQLPVPQPLKPVSLWDQMGILHVSLDSQQFS